MWLSEQDYHFIYQRVPRICVDLVVEFEGNVLLTFRSIEPHKDKWHLPGGAILFKESIEDAIYRIAKKELGIAVNINNFIGVMQFPNEVRDSNDYHSISLAYSVSPIGIPNDGSYFTSTPDNVLPEHGDFLRKYF